MEVVVEVSAEQLIASGYVATSNRYRMVSRLDRPDWRERMASGHVNGMEWVRTLGDGSAADFYRRVHSRDNLELSDAVFRTVKAATSSHGWGNISEYREKSF